MKKRTTRVMVGTVATIMVAGMALTGCNKNVATDVVPTTTAAPIETTTVAEPETTTAVVAEPETTTVVEPETTTAVVAEPETTTVAEPETTTAAVAEPETTTAAAEPETTTVAVEPETTTVAEPETTTVAEPETTTVAETEPVKDYVEILAKDEYGRDVPYRVYGDAPITPLEDWQTHALLPSNSTYIDLYYDNEFEPTYMTACTPENVGKYWDDDMEEVATFKEKYNLPNGVYERKWDLLEDLENYALLTTGVTHGIYDFDLDGKWIWETHVHEGYDDGLLYNVVEFNEDGTKWLDEYTQEWFDTPSLSMGDEGLEALYRYYDDRADTRRIILKMDEVGLEVGQYWYSRINLCDYGSVTLRLSETEVVSYRAKTGDYSDLLADYPDAVYWGQISR